MTIRIGTALMAALVAGFASMAAAQELRLVAISTIVEVPALMQSRDGILDGLAERGYVEGKNIRIDYQNANGSMPTQMQIANKFMGENPAVIVPITTPTAQAMISGTTGIPIVFAMVTDPVKAGLVPQFKQPGGRVTGVSDAEPIGPQLDLIISMVPNLKRLGFVYNPGLDNAIATLEVLKVEAAARGITVVESASPTTNEVILATRSLVGKVEAVYVPNDTTVVAALEAIIKVGGLDYRAVGHTAGLMVADVLDGKDPGTIDVVVAYEVHDKLETVINKGSAVKMGIVIPQAVLDAADVVIE